MHQAEQAAAGTLASEDQNLLASIPAELQKTRDELASLQADFKKYRIWSSATKIEDLWEWVEEIDARLAKTLPAISPQGQKTAARIAKLKEILKARGGSLQGFLVLSLHPWLCKATLKTHARSCKLFIVSYAAVQSWPKSSSA